MINRVLKIDGLKLLFILVLLFALVPFNDAKAQSNRVIKGYEVVDGDTIYSAGLHPIYFYGSDYKRPKGRAWREYYRTVYNFKKVYPYALKAKIIIMEADSILANSDFTKREREKYLKSYEKRLFKEFEKPLKKLSYSQGRLLLRLLDRELGQSSFNIIRNYRGKLAAGFWQGVAKLFGSDLKRPYDKYGTDKPIEELVQLYHKGEFDRLYYSMFRK